MHTSRLRDGTVVLAKSYSGDLVPLHYSNRTQAQRAAALVGGCVIQRGRPFYVMLDPQPVRGSALDVGPL